MAEVSLPVQEHLETNTSAIYRSNDSNQERDSRHVNPHPEPRRDDFIGERFIAGDTWYDFQSNGSIGKMIAVDAGGGVHITWMDGFEEDLFEGERHQMYNYLNPDEGWLAEDGEQVDFSERGGFGCLCLTTEEAPRALVFSHCKVDDEWRGVCSIDFALGLGAFQSVLLPRYPEQTAYFPQGVMSPEGRIHVIMQRRDRNMISYASGELNDGGMPEFGEVPIEAGVTHRTSFRIACSSQSERAVIVWYASRVGVPQPEDYPGQGYALNNDLMIAWTEDGENWNFDDPLNITDNIPPNPRLEGDASYGDTLRPSATMDVIFDPEDNIHVVFEARGFWANPLPEEDESPVEGITVDASYLFHWSEVGEEITPVADGWFTHREVDDEGEQIRWPTPGAWKSNVCQPSLAYDEGGDLYCVFNYYPPDDYSAEDYCNGDIAVTVSDDNGETWYMPTMITETRSHLAEEGEAECEVYPTLTYLIDDNLHITYELDTEPGTQIEDYQDRIEVPTLCQWLYHRVPVDEIARDELWEDGPTWHTVYVSVDDEEPAPVPDRLTLDPPYPNPFNSMTKISFSLRMAGDVRVALIDLAGRIVMMLVDKEIEAGQHHISIDGTKLVTGMYVVKAEGFGKVLYRKVLVVK